MIYHVQSSAPAGGDGSPQHPFRKISRAAGLAAPGDTVLIGDGVYREWVSPRLGGLGPNQRITYCAAPGARPVITGAEVLGGWQPWQGQVWRAEADNALFGRRNPYAEEIFGDWYDGLGQTHHTGEVFLDGAALYEAPSLQALLDPPADPRRPGRWFACPGPDTTVFYADFAGRDPAEACVEISVRPFCFFPRQTGVDYLTLQGLTFCQAATQWAPPTAFQPGAVGPHWSKGWIIEDCCIHDSKCCGLSLGKKRHPRDNAWSRDPAKGGTQTYTEMVFATLQDGWSRDKVGGHIVRRNEIYNCGQAGIVGCMGGAFSTIADNHIHHVNIRGEFSGAEMAGIKLHAAIDVVIDHNVIHDCNKGIWLDWQAQGAAVRRNLLYRNDREEDLFLEVCHGPCLVENNVLLSARSFLNVSQGTACLHNLFAGKLLAVPDTNRFTMYHLPHSTQVGGVMLVYGGDDRVLYNIFAGSTRQVWQDGAYGTACYQAYSHEAAPRSRDNDTPAADLGRTLPVTARQNLYLHGAECWQWETDPRTLPDFTAQISVEERDGEIWLCTNLEEIADALEAWRVDRADTGMLGVAFQPGQPFENRDGTPYRTETDLAGRPRPARPCLGPLEPPARRLRVL